MFTFHTDWIEVYPGRLKELYFYIRKERNEKQHVLKKQYKDNRLGAFLCSTKSLITRHTVDNEIMDEFLMSMDFYCN